MNYMEGGRVLLICRKWGRVSGEVLRHGIGFLPQIHTDYTRILTDYLCTKV